MKIENSNVNGILIVNKPSGLTSRDVVNKVSKILGTKKIGHTGTLDPLATGVLILTIGRFTKLSEFLMSNYKTYEVKMELGYLTDTLDTEGTILERSDKNVSNDEIINTIKSFVKEYIQEVPIYSAVKINGKKLYEYARNNEKVELPKRKVEIKDITDIKIHDKEISFTCEVSKGTYIRSLVRDIGEKLDTYATMISLKRTKQGNFTINDSYTIDKIEKGNFKLLNLNDIFVDIPIINVNEKKYKKVFNGIKQEENINAEYIAYKYKNDFVALYKKYDNNNYQMYVKF